MGKRFNFVEQFNGYYIESYTDELLKSHAKKTGKNLDGACVGFVFAFLKILAGKYKESNSITFYKQLNQIRQNHSGTFSEIQTKLFIEGELNHLKKEFYSVTTAGSIINFQNLY